LQREKVEEPVPEGEVPEGVFVKRVEELLSTSKFSSCRFLEGAIVGD
jgi:hypothetical protein